jgi:hypothetical protein
MMLQTNKKKQKPRNFTSGFYIETQKFNYGHPNPYLFQACGMGISIEISLI